MTAQPTVRAGGVVNAASYTPGIAQGSMFVIFGTAMGPGTLAQVNAFPIPTTLSGTSVRVTASAQTRDALIVYTSAAQIAAILPSDTPVGPATLTVSYQGQTTAPASFNGVSRNFGVFTNNSQGTGAAVVQNFNSQTDLGRNGLSEAANPGQVVILWGTGLGRISGSDAGAPPVGDIAPDLQITVGGRPATITYRGRSGCCAGIDQIVFAVPQGVEGCFVPVSIVGGATAANLTMSIATSGKACAEPGLISSGDLDRARQQGELRVGSVLLIRYGIADIPNTFDLGIASFSRTKYAQLLAASQRLTGAPYGSCEAARSDGATTLPIGGSLGFDFFDDYLFFSGESPLEAGERLSLSGGGQSFPLEKGGPGSYFGLLLNPQNPLGGVLNPGSYTLDNGSGGADVPAFRTQITVPARLQFAANTATSIPRSSNLTVNWTGGSADERVLISGISYDQNGRVGGVFTCAERGNAGRVTVPASTLALLPPSGSPQTGGGGFLFLYSFSPFTRQTVTGLDALYAAAVSLTFRIVPFN